jgi:predicted protein tyrosine phosphatase
VTHILSIRGPNSPDAPEFAAFAPHRRLILRFHDVIEPQPDPIAPRPAKMSSAAWPLAGRSARHRRLICSCIAVPGCRALPPALILMQANSKWTASAALDAVAEVNVPRGLWTAE